MELELLEILSKYFFFHISQKNILCTYWIVRPTESIDICWAFVHMCQCNYHISYLSGTWRLGTRQIFIASLGRTCLTQYVDYYWKLSIAFIFSICWLLVGLLIGNISFPFQYSSINLSFVPFAGHFDSTGWMCEYKCVCVCLKSHILYSILKINSMPFKQIIFYFNWIQIFLVFLRSLTVLLYLSFSILLKKQTKSAKE